MKMGLLILACSSAFASVPIRMLQMVTRFAPTHRSASSDNLPQKWAPTVQPGNSVGTP